MFPEEHYPNLKLTNSFSQNEPCLPTTVMENFRISISIIYKNISINNLYIHMNSFCLFVCFQCFFFFHVTILLSGLDSCSQFTAKRKCTQITRCQSLKQCFENNPYKICPLSFCLLPKDISDYEFFILAVQKFPSSRHVFLQSIL